MPQLRNTPDPDSNISPAQIIFGRPLRDTLSFVNRLEKYSNPNVRPTWRQAWAAKEEALCTRITRTMESLKEHSRTLRPLAVGERVFLQNQQGASPTKWDRSGVVVETPGHDLYRVKVDGSGRLTLRNRRFLRAYTAASPSIDQGPRAQQQPLNREVEQAQYSPRWLPEERPHPSTSPAYLQEKSLPPSNSAVAPRGKPAGTPPTSTQEGPAPPEGPSANDPVEIQPLAKEPEVAPHTTPVLVPQSSPPRQSQHVHAANDGHQSALSPRWVDGCKLTLHSLPPEEHNI